MKMVPPLWLVSELKQNVFSDVVYCINATCGTIYENRDKYHNII